MNIVLLVALTAVLLTWKVAKATFGLVWFLTFGLLALLLLSEPDLD